MSVELIEIRHSVLGCDRRAVRVVALVAFWFVVGTNSKLEERVVRAAEAALAERKYVTAIDVLVGVGWLAPRRVEEWRQGRVAYLERAVEAGLGNISTAMRVFGG